MVEALFAKLAALPEVEAIALGGSRAGENFDKNSDYDVYLYCTGDIDEAVRRELLQEYCSYMEIGNCFWEYEDNCVLKDGTDIDILYRRMDEFCDTVAAVVERYQACNGYTTCMWHNLLTCKIIYDENGRLHAAKERFDVPYPKQLRDNIIENNMRLLSDAMPAYRLQIAKAVKRGDTVSVNHRTAAFMESYFDIIWALNSLTHPGEKRLVSLCLRYCSILPEHFEDNINALYADLFTNPQRVDEDIDKMICELKKLM